MDIFKESENLKTGLSKEEINTLLVKSLEGKKLKKVLIIPPDITRYYSNAGYITNFYYHYLKNNGVKVVILPALGTHSAMTEKECADMYGDIPYSAFVYHNWREDVVKIGTVEGEFVSSVTESLWDEPIDVEVNKLILDKSFDLVLSVGQVVPHEVIGMSNHSKNLFVGTGGSAMINKSHMVGAVYGLERMMGKDFSPVRKIFDYALEKYLSDVNILFVLTVTTAPEDSIITHGVFIGEERKSLERAIALSQKVNVFYVDKPIKKCVVYLTPKEFKSTWLGNKAVYRTRTAMATGGELIILAEGVEKFGEDPTIDALIRKYGYVGRLKILELFKQNEDLQNNMGAAAHLIHGSSDGRFSITYCVKNISEEEVKGVGYNSASYDEMAAKVKLGELKDGYNTVDGEEIYFISNPALGLWSVK